MKLGENMEIKIMEEIGNRIKRGEKAALVILTQIDGSSPGRCGNMMAIFEDGSTLGTVGGGNLEHTLTREGIEALKIQQNKEIQFKLVEDAALHMKCGGDVKAFIKIFEKKNRVLIVGGGHVGAELYNLFQFLDWEIEIFDDRTEFCNKIKFPVAKNLMLGNIEKNLENYFIDEKCHIIIVSRGHLEDKNALRQVIKKNAKYIGMIGSRKKVSETIKELIIEGIDRELFEKIYSPIGLDISSGTPKEIAFSIVAEILKVKNNGTGQNMKNIKKIEF